jgi:hypothetical protein
VGTRLLKSGDFDSGGAGENPKATRRQSGQVFEQVVFVLFADRKFPGTPLATPSGGARSRRVQALRNLTEDLLVVSGYRALHMNASALCACFLRQPLELSLKKNFQLLRRQDGNGNSRGLAGPVLDLHAVWGF